MSRIEYNKSPNGCLCERTSLCLVLYGEGQVTALQQQKLISFIVQSSGQQYILNRFSGFQI